MNLFLDIETIPSQVPGAWDTVRANLRPPAAMKLPATIEKWWREEADAAAEEQWRKQSFDATFGEICSIAVVDDCDRQFVRCRRQGQSEAELIREAFAAVEGWTRDDAAKIVPNHPDAWPVDDHCIVGHNASFDTTFLWRRCIVHDLARPGWLPWPMARAGRDFQCTMLMWSGHGGRVSLDALAKALHIPSPKAGGLDGSGILDAWLADEYDRIAEYNLRDALTVREIFHRLLGLPRAAA
jgi:3'-5' exonuclease